MSELPPVEVDALEHQCPMPLLMAKRALNGLEVGRCVRVRTKDQGSVRDFQVLAQQSGHMLVSSEEEQGVYIHVLKKC